MGILSTGMNILGGLVNAGSTIAGTVDSINTNRENLALQKENLAYQKDLQHVMFQREDNAVQRRVADLKAAGLSPTLAAGSAAAAGPVISTSAPQRKSNFESLMALASVGTALAQQQKAQTEADIARNKLIQDKMDTAYYKSKGLSPVESELGYKQLLTNVLNGWLNRNSPSIRDAATSLILRNARANPNPPKDIGADGSITNSKGQTISSSQAGKLKSKGLYMTFLNNGLTADVVKALDTRSSRKAASPRIPKGSYSYRGVDYPLY